MQKLGAAHARGPGPGAAACASGDRAPVLPYQAPWISIFLWQERPNEMESLATLMQGIGWLVNPFNY